MSEKNKAAEILEKAKGCVTGDRHDRYGNPERNFGRIAQFWNDYLGNRLVNDLTAEDVGIMMAFQKIARIMSGTEQPDSYIDACGYLAISGELAGEKTWISQD